MKKINLKEAREWGVLALALVTLIIGIMTYIVYLKSYPQVEPDIRIGLSDSTNIRLQDLADIYRLQDGTIFTRDYSFNFKITNLGQKDSNYMNFYIKDPLGEYESHFGSNTLDNLEHLQNKFIQIPIVNSDCLEIYQDKWKYNFDYKEIYHQCELIRNNLSLGEKEFLLRVDCPGCSSDRNTQCYSFKVCIYDTNESLTCGRDEKYYELEEKPCPENWWD